MSEATATVLPAAAATAALTQPAPGKDPVTVRFFVVIVMTYLVALGKFAHIIAGSVDTLYVVWSGGAGLSDYLAWMVPTLAGNIVGGATLVAALGHAQVANEARKRG